MEGKDKFEELILAYLLDELSSKEEAIVLDRIKSDEQTRQYYEELKRTLKIINLKETFDKVNVDKEWIKFEQARLRREHPVIFMSEAERFGNEVIKEVKFKRTTKIFKSISAVAVAASVLLAIGLGWSLLYNKKATPRQNTVAAVEKPAEVKSLTRHLANTSGKAASYLLSDGTEVTLEDKSELSFLEHFEANKRDIQLKGKATFKVAKDKTRPFTVYSGNVSTTALGTVFTVTEQANRVIVTLFEGKVVVKGMDLKNKTTTKTYYLLPGQEVVIDKNRLNNHARISNVAKEPVTEKQDLTDLSKYQLEEDKPSIPSYGKGSWYMFNNQSLDNVFDQLASMYNAEIKYNKKDVEKMYFIGTFSKTDSLEMVLKQIALLNNLKVTRENSKFIISK